MYTLTILRYRIIEFYSIYERVHRKNVNYNAHMQRLSVPGNNHRWSNINMHCLFKDLSVTHGH